MPKTGRKAATSATPKKRDASFAKQFAELEQIVAAFEQKHLNLDESLEQFERGLKIASDLKKQLEGVENSIETLKKRYHAEEA